MRDVDSVTNPYETPTSTSSQVAVDAGKNDGCEFGVIIRRWERLRLFYNAVLMLVVLVLTAFAFPRLFGDLVFWRSLVVGAIIANVGFFAGPTGEGYGTVFKLWHPMFTTVLFIAQLGFSTLLAVVCVVGYAIPTL
ncbi:MAG: hypothetical protein NXI22_12545 [bacterium]|nr:hypothetical protein [bacterium]